jgi:2-oxoisovalerate dehydrogenase E2 component (dihydrolipoyl transacylase)
VAYTVKLPDVGEGIAQAEIVAWHVNIGDAVREDDVIAEIMTDKATVELPSPVSGVIAWLGAAVGDILSVGADLIKIETGVQGPTSEADRSTFNVAAVATPPALQGVDVVGLEAEISETVAPNAQGVTESFLGSNEVLLEGRKTIAMAGVPIPLPTSSESNMEQATREKPLAAPAVRDRAQRLGINLAGLAGTGIEGRIVHRDLDEIILQRTDEKSFGTAVSSTSASTSTSPSTTIEKDTVNDITRTKVIGLRRNIAERMQLSKRRIPHFTYVEEIDVTELERLRIQLNSGAADRLKLTVLPFIMRAVVKAIESYPQMNARFDDDAGVIERHRDVRLGIAVQTTKGLMVPVVRDMHTLDLWQSAAEVARLSELARTSKIKIEELIGSTITISSLGSLGGIMATPIINYPEVAVIGVNKIAERPVYINGELLPRKMMNLSSSFDHRVIDGADAADFIQALKGFLETPALLFLDS